MNNVTQKNLKLLIKSSFFILEFFEIIRITIAAEVHAKNYQKFHY